MSCCENPSTSKIYRYWRSTIIKNIPWKVTREFWDNYINKKFILEIPRVPAYLGENPRINTQNYFANNISHPIYRALITHTWYAGS